MKWVVKIDFSPDLQLAKRQYMYLVFKVPTVYSSRRAAILYSKAANITDMTNIPSTNDTKNMFLEILKAPNIPHSKDNEMADLKTFPTQPAFTCSK